MVAFAVGRSPRFMSAKSMVPDVVSMAELPVRWSRSASELSAVITTGGLLICGIGGPPAGVAADVPLSRVAGLTRKIVAVGIAPLGNGASGNDSGINVSVK